MNKIYTFLKSKSIPAFFSCLLFSSTSYGQTPICGPLTEDFNNTSGSTAGFTGELHYKTNGTNGCLMKDRVLASGVYSPTSPTYKMPENANSVGFGFVLDGTEKIARVEVTALYISTLNGELTPILLSEFVPSYHSGTSSVEICRAVALSDLPGFPTGGLYRLHIELTSNTGGGNVGQTVMFDNFRTNGTRSEISLPVNFISFDAKKVNGNVLLTWETAGEENVSAYQVERSVDGHDFAKIASITPSGEDTYSYTDLNKSTTAYYRIRNVDRDGKFKYSPTVRIVNGKSEMMFKAFPQPVQNQLTIQHPRISGRGLLNVTTIDGRVVRSQIPAAGSMQTNVDMSGLQKGIYVIRFDIGDGNLQAIKMVKQ